MSKATFTTTPIVWVEVRGETDLVMRLHDWCGSQKMWGVGPAGQLRPAFGLTVATRHNTVPGVMVFHRGFTPHEAERVALWIREQGGTEK